MPALPRSSAVPDAPLVQPSPDDRVRAGAAVLAGEPVEQVARRCGADARQVLRWAHALEAGGAAAVGEVGLDRPAEGPAASRVAVEDVLSVVAHEVRAPLHAGPRPLVPLARVPD